MSFDSDVSDLLLSSLSFAFCHGVVMMAPADPSHSTTHPSAQTGLPSIVPLSQFVASTAQTAPFTLLPSPVSRKCFEFAVELAPLFGLLVHRISHNPEFIISSLASIPESDSFTRRLIEMYSQLQQEPTRQKIELGLFRSDYMFHQSQDQAPPTLQQVELNTIAASFASLSTLVSEMHRFQVESGKVPESVWKQTGSANLSGDTLPDIHRMPKNQSLYSLPAAIAQAFELYGDTSAVTMMVVQGAERNTSDQRFIEFNLWSRHKIKMIRRTLTEIGERGKLNATTGALEIDGFTVAVTYFRAGYTPNDYPSETEWDARLLIERSLSIKSPNLAYHLIGTKKIQQELAVSGVLEKFMSPDECRTLRGCFAGLWPLGDEQKEKETHILEKAIQDPHLYVLKPQREGGGNNLYGDDIRTKLGEMSAKERAAYILMSKIEPKSFSAILCRQSKLYQVLNASSELGIYNWFLSDEKGEIKLNSYGGFLLRTKITDQEAGLVAGFGALDSPYLVD